MMDESRNNQLISQVFKRLLSALDQLDSDPLDADSTGDMLTFTAANGEKCVVNTQRAVRQLWVAGKGQGIHFSFDEADRTWNDDKGRGLELFAFVAEVVHQIAGVKLQLR